MESDDESPSVSPTASADALQHVYDGRESFMVFKAERKTTGFKCKPMKNRISHFSRSCNTHCCACCDAFLEYYAEVFRFIKLYHQGKLRKEPTYVADIFAEIVDIGCCWMRDCCTFLKLIFKCLVCVSGSKRGGKKYHCRQFKTKMYNPVRPYNGSYSDQRLSDIKTNLVYTSKSHVSCPGDITQSTLTQKPETKNDPTQKSKSSLAPAKSVKSILSNKSRKSLMIDDRSSTRSRHRSRHRHERDRYRSHSDRRHLGRSKSVAPFSYSSMPMSYRYNGRSASMYSNLSRNYYSNKGFYVLKHDKRLLGLRPMPFRQWGGHHGCVVMRLSVHRGNKMFTIGK